MDTQKLDVLLEAKQISKQFPGVLALNKVDFKVYAGKVHALVGENGAGKSTLMNILSGVYTDYQGELLLEGRPLRFAGTADAQNQAVAMIHQELNLIPNLTVSQNIYLGREPLNAFGLIDVSTMQAEAAILLKKLHFDAGPDQLVANLRPGQKQIVEIAKALSLRAKVLIMDEPGSSLSEKESKLLFQLIKDLTQEQVGIAYISHKMQDVMQLADYITILRDGSVVEACPLEQISEEQMVRKMVGREYQHFFVKRQHSLGSKLLQVRNLSLQDSRAGDKYLLRDISFSVRAGEVLGIYGLMGAGRTELLQALFACYGGKTEGSILVEGSPLKLKNTAEALNRGLALIPEDRQSEGLVLAMNIQQNITLASLKDFLKNGLISFKKEREQSDRLRSRLKIKSYSGQQLLAKLSGGNQQKVVLAKCLLTKPKILLLDEPTRGIDIHAKNEIYKWMDDLAEQGLALVVVSSELPEIMAVSNRILTLCEGRITASFERPDFDEENILKAVLPDYLIKTDAL